MNARYLKLTQCLISKMKILVTIRCKGNDSSNSKSRYQPVLSLLERIRSP